MRTRDSQRSRVTRAMFVESNTKCTRAEAIALAARLLRSKWFTKNFVPIGGRHAFEPFKWTKSRRALAYALAWYFREKYDFGKLRTNRWAYQHGAPHGREFCHVLLRFVEKLEGKDAAFAVRVAFKKHKVKYSKPRERRALPPLQRAALAARLDGARAKRDAAKHAATVVLTAEKCARCGRAYIAGDPFMSHEVTCKWYGVE